MTRPDKRTGLSSEQLSTIPPSQSQSAQTCMQNSIQQHSRKLHCIANIMNRLSQKLQVVWFSLKNKLLFSKSIDCISSIQKSADFFGCKERECIFLCLVPRGKCQRLHIHMVCLDNQIQSFQNNWLNISKEGPMQQFHSCRASIIIIVLAKVPYIGNFKN